MLHGFSAEACMDAVHVEAARMEDTRMPDGSCMDAAPQNVDKNENPDNVDKNENPFA